MSTVLPSFISTLYPLIGEAEVRVSYLVRVESNSGATVTWVGTWVTNTHIAFLTAPYEARDADDEDKWAAGWGRNISQKAGYAH